MKKKKVSVSVEARQIAESNGISTTTVYRRVAKGWRLQDAITIPTDAKDESKRRKSPLYGMGRGKSRGFRLPKAWDKQLDDVIEQSGLTENDWIAEAIALKLGIELPNQ